MDSNTKLGSRTFELNKLHPNNSNATLHKQHTDRLSIERSQLSGMDMRTKKNQGEITGVEIDPKDFDIDHGMPMRSQYTFKKGNQDLQPDSDRSTNKYLDFNIYNDETPTKFNVSYHDPTNNSLFDFTNFTNNDTKLVKNTDDANSMRNNINDFSWYLHENISHLMPHTNTLINSFGIMSTSGALYLASKGEQEQELRNYFSFNTKTNVYQGLSLNKKYIDKSECYENHNLIIINKDTNPNTQFINYIKPIAECIIVSVSKDDATKESVKINKYINNMFNGVPGIIFRKDHIENLEITCLCVSLLRTVWKEPFDEILANHKMFNTKTNSYKSVPAMRMYNKTHLYFEDVDKQILELPMYDDVFNMGIIIMKKHKLTPDIDIKTFNLYANNLKPVIIDEIIIPKFTGQSKLRISSLFKKTGLEKIFAKAELPELTKNNSYVTDVIQNCTIIVDEKYSETAEKPRTKHNTSTVYNRKFIVSGSFIYYFKCVSTGAIILVGQQF